MVRVRMNARLRAVCFPLSTVFGATVAHSEPVHEFREDDIAVDQALEYTC